MSQSVKQILGQDFTAKHYRHIEEEEGEVYEYIVKEAADTQIRQFSQDLQEQLQKAIVPILQKILGPQLEVRHVREEGLRIWGKSDNVAFSKSTIVGLLEMLLAPKSDQFEATLFLAGRQAALGFFDQFRRILRVGDETRLPNGVIPFLQALGEFDERSGWWTGIDYDDSVPETVSVTVSKPFWRFPYTDTTNNHYFSDFAAGYILSLHNACYDYLSIISQVAGWKFDDLFAVEAKVFKDPDPDKCHLQLRRTKKSVAEFENINAMICLLVEWLLDDSATDKHREEIEKKLHQIDDEIHRVFGEDAQLDKSRLSEVNQEHYRPQYVRSEFTQILQQVRCRYEDLRIAKLKS